MTLRDRLAETLAEYCGAGYEALDAILAVLAESADETVHVDGAAQRLGDVWTEDLLAVLQGEPE
jgi:hypothetical protein